jgi:hypothetical protein
MSMTEPASNTLVVSRDWRKPLGEGLVEVIPSEAQHWGGLLTPTGAAAKPTWRTVLRIAKRWTT